MSIEGEHSRQKLTAIHIDLISHSVILEGSKGSIGTLTFSAEGVIFESGTAPPVALLGARSELKRDPARHPDADTQGERQRAVVLSGVLKTKPKQGRPDSRGNPTAWARMVVHDEGSDEAHIYGVSFHRGAAGVALSLNREAHLTVKGYAHAQVDRTAGRLDTLSVVTIVDYPGKPPKQQA